MLLKIFLRDLILTKKMIILYLALMTVAFIGFYSFSPIPGFALTYAYIWIALIPIVIFSREDKFKATAVTCSLPVSRSQIIRARYGGAWFIIICGILYTGLLLLIFQLFGKSAAGYLTPGKLFDALIIFSLIIGLCLPFIIRFGLYGLMGILVLFQILGVFLLLFAKIFRSNIATVIDSIIDFFKYLQRLQTSAWYYPVALLCLILFNLLSLQISTWLFNRKEL